MQRVRAGPRLALGGPRRNGSTRDAARQAIEEMLVGRVGAFGKTAGAEGFHESRRAPAARQRWKGSKICGQGKKVNWELRIRERKN